jgi:hypothetical protein
MSVNLKDRWFEVFMLLLGVSIGFVPTWYLQSRQEGKLRESIAVLLRTNAFQEVAQAKRVHASIENAIKDKWAGKIAMQSFQWFNDPTLILSVSSNIGYMEPEIVDAFETYYRSLKQCHQMQESLAKNEVVQFLETNLKAYVTTLDVVIERGSRLMTAIDQHYPGAKLSN